MPDDFKAPPPQPEPPAPQQHPKATDIPLRLHEVIERLEEIRERHGDRLPTSLSAIRVHTDHHGCGPCVNFSPHF